MNDVKKGAVTVILATVVTSAMILMNGKGSADNNQSATEIDQPVNIEKTTVEIIEVKNTAVEAVKAETIMKTEANMSVAKVLPNTLLPPPGPFSKEVVEALGKPQTPKLSTPPVPPESTKKTDTKKPEMPQAPINSIEKPVQITNLPTAPKAVEKFEAKPAANIAPQWAKKIPNAPFAPQIPSFKTEFKKAPELPNNTLITNQHMPKSPASPQANALQKPMPNTINSNQPIWMQRNKADTGKATPQMNQAVNKRSHQPNAMQMPNPNGVRYMQQYRYMPMPVYPNYQYPQMPGYNRGYYFAPIPNQWIQSGMQMPNSQERMKMNQVPQDATQQNGLNK